MVELNRARRLVAYAKIRRESAFFFQRLRFTMRTKPGSDGITDRQRLVLKIVISGLRDLGTAPARPWVAARLGVRSLATIRGYFQSLERRHMAEFVEGRIVPTDEGYAAVGMLPPLAVERALREAVLGKGGAALKAEVKRHFDAIEKLV
jgi:hypothetical protein